MPLWLALTGSTLVVITAGYLLLVIFRPERF